LDFHDSSSALLKWRQYKNLKKINKGKKGKAEQAVMQINKLYRIETAIKALDVEEKQQIRQEKAFRY